MSLLRLLNAGSSLIGSNKAEVRYRMGDPRAMPKFEASRNPFRAKSETSPASEEPAAAATPAAVPASSPTPTVQPALGNATQVSSAPSRGWLKRLLTGWWPRSKKAEPRAVPQFAKPAVQGELSLDAVRVVRNDLSDADWEIVPAKRQSSTTEAVAVVRETSPEPGVRLWRGPRRVESREVEVDQT